MSRKRLRTVIRITAYAIVVAMVVCIMKFASKSDVKENAFSGNSISFSASALQKGSQIVAENKKYILSADFSKTSIALTDRATGETVYGALADLEQRNDIKAAVKTEASSLLDIKYADRDSNVSKQNSITGCLKKNNVSAKKIENGVRFDYYFSSEGFLIPLEITLTDDGLKVNLPLGEIKEENQELKLISVSIFPNFGAKNTGTKGYMLVPDGSGAIISYDAYDTAYSQRIYGNDPAVSASVNTGGTEQTARLPVFGATDLTQAFIGIITSGDARANVNAKTATAKSPYASVYAEFIYREIISVNVNRQTFESTQANMFEPNHCGLDSFTVEYRTTEKPDYVGMANAYRNYLINNVGMKRISDSAAALQLQLIGGVMHSENFLGVPVNRVLPVTSYDDAAELSERFSSLGADRLCINYLDWYDDATDNRLTLKIAPESRLGGKKAFEAMMKKLSSSGKIFLNLNFTGIYKSHDGYSVRYDSARNVLQEPLGVYTYYLSTYQKNSSVSPLILLAPAAVTKASDRFLSRIGSFSEYCYSVNSMGSVIYSDFAKTPTDRGAMRAVFIETLEKIEKATGGLLFDSANAYALPYAKVIQGVPVESSEFICESDSVPFYAFALHGLVQMGTSPVNASADQNYVRLKALESGISTTYVLGVQNTNGYKNTASSDYSYINTDKWIDRAAEDYSLMSEYLNAVEAQPVAEHTKLAEGVYKTVFENGMGVTVNYGNAAVSIDGVTVEAGGFVPIGW